MLQHFEDTPDQGTVTGKYQWDDSKKKNTDADKAILNLSLLGFRVYGRR